MTLLYSLAPNNLNRGKVCKCYFFPEPTNFENQRFSTEHNLFDNTEKLPMHQMFDAVFNSSYGGLKSHLFHIANM